MTQRLRQRLEPPEYLIDINALFAVALLSRYNSWRVTGLRFFTIFVALKLARKWMAISDIFS